MTRSHPETNYPCDCDVLDRAADEPDTPIAFDAQTNEYQLVHSEENRGLMVFYYCPFCGGRTPDTRRGRLFARITFAEVQRLKKLTRDIKTIDDAIRVLGKPDADHPDGITTQTPDSETEPTQIKSYRMITYSGLSETAVVQITDYRRDRVEIQFTGKFLKGGQSAQSADKPARAQDAPVPKGQEDGRKTVYCSFCGQSEHGVERMLRSYAAAICNDCAELFIQGSGR